MSLAQNLLQPRWIVPGAAALLAVAVPFWLLQPGEQPVETAPPLVVTDLALAPVGGLDQARAAPLFSSTRAPFDPAAPPPGSQGVEAAPAASPMPLLVGLVSRARGRGVALVKGSNGQTVTIIPGESVDGWRLLAIGRDRATFASNGERRVAALDFSNKPSSQGGAPPAPSSEGPIPLPPAGVPASSVRQPPYPAWPEPWLANQSGTSR
jgi:hypothetical protein